MPVLLAILAAVIYRMYFAWFQAFYFSIKSYYIQLPKNLQHFVKTHYFFNLAKVSGCTFLNHLDNQILKNECPVQQLKHRQTSIDFLDERLLKPVVPPSQVHWISSIDTKTGGDLSAGGFTLPEDSSRNFKSWNVSVVYGCPTTRFHSKHFGFNTVTLIMSFCLLFLGLYRCRKKHWLKDMIFVRYMAFQVMKDSPSVST